MEEVFILIIFCQFLHSLNVSVTKNEFYKCLNKYEHEKKQIQNSKMPPLSPADVGN